MDYKKNGVVLEIKTGSHLYGTNVETSDEDFVGVYIPSYFELLTSDKYIKEKDFSIKSKDKNGKNDKNAVDRKYYNFNNFIKLLISNNPNILEILYANDENITYVNPIGQKLIDNRHLFPSIKLVKRFIGYSNQQSHKMEIKSNKFNEMNIILEYLKSINPKLLIAELQYDNEFKKLLEECKTNEIKQDGKIKKVIRLHDDFLTIGDLNIPINVYVKNACSRLQNRISKGTSRNRLITKYGYDVKFGMHLIRLLIEGLQFLKFGELQFPLPEKDLLLSIRNGELKIDEIFDLRDKLLQDITYYEKITNLQITPNLEVIGYIMNECLNDYINGDY